MDDFEREMADFNKRYDRLQAKADQYSLDIVKYFDRINDKLFNLNNLLIGAYFALVTIRPSTPKGIIFIPLINSILMIFIDYLMMESSRRMSSSMDMSPAQIAKETKKMDTINVVALVPIITTLIVLSLLCVNIYYYL